MKKIFSILCCSLALSIPTVSSAVDTDEIKQEQAPLLITFQKSIFEEMIRSHGTQLESESVLNWCSLNGLADEIKLSTNELKRALYDSFIVAGTQNVQATEIARQMTDDQWRLYNHALTSDIKRYQDGISKGLSVSLATKKKKNTFCIEAEALALKAAQTISH